MQQKTTKKPKNIFSSSDLKRKPKNEKPQKPTKTPGPQLGPALIMIPAGARNKQSRTQIQAKLSENIGKAREPA